MLKQGVFLRKTAAVKSVLNETCLNKISYLVARMNVNDSGIKKCLIGESYHFCRLKCCLRGWGGQGIDGASKISFCLLLSDCEKG